MYPDRVIYQDNCPPLLTGKPERAPEASMPTPPSDGASEAEIAKYKSALKAYNDYQHYQQSIDHTNQYNSDMLAASLVVYSYCNRLILKQEASCTWNIRQIRQYTLHLPLYPVVSERLEITDDQDTQYQYQLTDPNIVRLISYPPVNSVLTCTYTGGYDRIPQPLLYAVGSIMQSIGIFDYNRSTQLKEGKQSKNYYPLWQADSSFEEQVELPLKVIPFAVKQMLNPYIRMVI